MTTSDGSPTAPALDLLTRTELETVAYRQGYRIRDAEDQGWLRRRSANAPASLWLTGQSAAGPFFAATDHDGVAREIPPTLGGRHPGAAGWRAETIHNLHDLVNRIFRLSVSLPTHPLVVYQRQLADTPTLSTETDAMKKMRVGQDAFRAALLAYWKGTCPLTGISEPALLRASHIRPWAECEDAERLDVHNGLLLSALWDAAFDRGLVSFGDNGTALLAPALGQRARAALSGELTSPMITDLRPGHLERLAVHRKRHGFGD